MGRLSLIMVVYLLGLLALGPADARNVKLFVSIDAALQVDDVDDKPKGGVKFFFGEQKTPKIARSIGREIIYRKAAAMGKSEEISCSWAFQYVLAEFERKARQFGADAVVNITSLYQKEEFSSPTKFECHAGTVITGVRLRGEFVKLAD